MKLSPAWSAAVVMGAVLASAGCQRAEFEPVEPWALAQTTERVLRISVGPRPNMMLVMDRSGSMLEPIDPADGRCQDGCGIVSACAGDCPTRMGEMKSAMSDFLSWQGAQNRLGLTVFPKEADEVCAPGETTIEISGSDDVAQELGDHAGLIDQQIQLIQPGGGTPTTKTLEALENRPALTAASLRENFILLLTDGLPNCNAALDPSTCSCSVPGMNLCSAGGMADSRQCLDDDRVVQVIGRLKAKGIKTIVVGFGADATGEAAQPTLNAMAEAGGFARACWSASDCGDGQSCNGGTCSRKYYAAGNAAELRQALAQVVIEIQDACVFSLTATPSEEGLLAVWVNDEPVTTGADTWLYSADAGDPKVTFHGSLCERARSSTVANPLQVEIRLVERL